MRDIDAIARGGTAMADNMNNIMKDSIKQIKVLAPSLLPVFQFHYSRLFRTHIPLWVITIGTSVVIMDSLLYSTQ
jgi:protein-S-isoprenylcysteine O-methyltransferase Ste14